jgi:hypothetical protein
MSMAFDLIVGLGAVLMFGAILAGHMHGRDERAAVRRVAKSIRRQLRGKLNLPA